MSTALGLAIYGSVVASGGLSWQAWTWWQGHRLRLRVTARLATLFDVTGRTDVVEINAVSHTAHPLRVTNVALKTNHGTACGVTPHPLATMPGVIAPHDAAQAFLLCDSLVKGGVDLRQPVRAGVYLSTGEVVWSEPGVLDA